MAENDKSSTTQRERILEMLQGKFPEYHPLMALAEMAHDAQIEPRVRADCHKSIAKYVEPELKSVEVKGDVKSDLGVLRVILHGDDDDGSGEVSGGLPDDTTVEIVEMSGEA